MVDVRVNGSFAGTFCRGFLEIGDFRWSYPVKKVGRQKLHMCVHFGGRLAPVWFDGVKIYRVCPSLLAHPAWTARFV